jgi:hypothetical protein
MTDIINNFYPLTRSETLKLAVKHRYRAIVQDMRLHKHESYVATILNKEGFILSPDAKSIIDDYKNLVDKSMPIRKAISKDPDLIKFHLDVWDIGYYQLRNGVLKKHFPQEYLDFTNKFKDLSKRMQPLVYDLGFLRR